jgi:hypothetical protein
VRCDKRCILVWIGVFILVQAAAIALMTVLW